MAQLNRLSSKAAGRCLLLAFALVLQIFGSQRGMAVSIEAEIRPVGSALQIRAIVHQAPVGELVIAFAGRTPTGASVRIRSLRVHTGAGEPVTVRTKRLQNDHLYSVYNKKESDLLVTYEVDPVSSQWDFYMPVVTTGHLQFPLRSVLFTIYPQSQPDQPLGKSASLRLAGLPEKWQVISSCSLDSLEIHNVPLDNDCVVHAGDYLQRNLKIGHTSFRLALSKELEYDTEALEQISAVLAEQHRMFGGYESAEALVVINLMPAYAKTLKYGGYTQPGHVIFYSKAAANDSDSDTRLVQNMAHETFHLWLGRSFNQYESMYWLTEGFTQYQALRTMWKLRFISDQSFAQQLTQELATTLRAQERAPVSLIRAGFSIIDPDYRALDYSKGALVAWLLDRELIDLGGDRSDFAGLMRFLYEEYAVKHVPVGNEEVVMAINRFTGDTRFTQQWVLEPTPLTTADVPSLQTHLQQTWRASLPTKIVDWSKQPAPIIAYAVLGGIIFATWYGTLPERVARVKRKRDRLRDNS